MGEGRDQYPFPIAWARERRPLVTDRMKAKTIDLAQTIGYLAAGLLKDELSSQLESVEIDEGAGRTTACLDVLSVLEPLTRYPVRLGPIVRREVAARKDAEIWTDQRSGVGAVVEWFFLWHWLSMVMDEWPVLLNRINLPEGAAPIALAGAGDWLAMGLAEMALARREDEYMATISSGIAGVALSIQWREAGITPPPWSY